MISEKGTIVRIESANLDGCFSIHVLSMKEIKHARAYSEDCILNVSVKGKEAFGRGKVEDPVIWELNNPKLYRLTVEIEFEDGESEKIEERYAFRTLGQNGKYITLNGKPIFIRGYIRGATAHEHSNDGNLSEEEFYRKNIVTAKKFGFNFIRFHSVVPNETFFKVADEEGILVHLELRSPNDSYNNLEEMLYSKKDLVPDSFILNVINTKFNHPSLAVYCIGNEIKGLDSDVRCDQIGKLIKKEDPSRLYIDTCAWGVLNRPNIDMDVQHLSYFFPFGKHASMYSDPKTIHTLKDVDIEDGESPYKVPLIAHEVCHYTALRDFASLKKKFDEAGTKSPWWIEEELKLIKSKGFNNEYQRMFAASKHFQFICWKTAYEAMRLSPLLGGFQFLQFADTDVYENSNGVVDCFDDITETKPDEFLKFNGDRVLLIRLPKRNYRAGEVVSSPLYLSNFGETNISSLKATVLLQKDGEEILEETIDTSIPSFGLNQIGSLSVALPKGKSAKYSIVVKAVINEAETIINIWDVFSYDFKKAYTYSEFLSYKSGNTVVTSDIKKAIEQADAGNNVALIYRSKWTRHLLDKTQEAPDLSFRATWNRFKPVIWDRGTNFGGLASKGILEKYGFPTGDKYDFNFCVLSEDCDKVILDDFPIKPASLISGIDKSNRDRFDAYKVSFNLPELMPDRTLRDFSYLFELKVGKGKLLVCGLNLTGLDSEEPSSEAMANFVIDYISSQDFDPKASISLSDFKTYLEKSAKEPVKERMMTQFWELDDAPVESKEYWEASKAYLTEK